MKKQMWQGVALGISLVLSGVGYANSVRETSDTASLQKIESFKSSSNPTTEKVTSATGPLRDRLTSDTTNLGERWNGMDRNNSTELLAFTSTAAANNAAKLIVGDSNSLSFANFGRVPFYQVLALTNDVNSNDLNKKSTRPSAALPEPTTLALLGAGLAALAAGLRKRKKETGK